MEMARTGQVAMQAPQPVQSSRRTNTVEPPPRRGLNLIAEASQAASHMRQVTPLVSTQAFEMRAPRCHGRPSRLVTKHPSAQAAAHEPQNVQCALAKSTIGYPACPVPTSPVGHAATHFPHCVQASVKSFSALAQGGRNWGGPPRKRAKSARRLSAEVMCHPSLGDHIDCRREFSFDQDQQRSVSIYDLRLQNLDRCIALPSSWAQGFKSDQFSRRQSEPRRCSRATFGLTGQCRASLMFHSDNGDEDRPWHSANGSRKRATCSRRWRC